MRMTVLHLAWFFAAIGGGWIARADDPVVREGEDFFEQRVRPILLEHCSECHGADTQEAGLRTDRRAHFMRGGESGPVLTAGKPDESRLIQVVRYDSKVQMPPDQKLPDEAISVLTEWVSRGAPWPEDPAEENAPPATEAATKTIDASSHWAFQPVQHFSPPLVKQTDWPKTPIDPFVLARLEAKNLLPNPQADRRTLIRRATYDLTGLPPMMEEVKAFVADETPDAYARLIDRLLASPRYGERWGRHWLDVARYSDTKGYVGVDAGDVERREYPFAFSYRDWVIKAINDDLPYDQFLIQQIAADKLELGDDKSALAALGFFRVGRVFLNNERDQIDDKIDVLMRGTQGLTVACARCHDHKYDPIPTADYYSLVGVFNSTNNPDDAERKLMLLADKEHPENAPILRRGNPASPGEVVPRQFVSVLSGPERKPFSNGSGRLELAQAIANPQNPLTARVMVNRVWADHLGSALVDSTSDFGTRSDAPSHPDLLDYLAQQFVEGGWSLKNLHRLIMNSATYRQSSQNRAEAVAIDADNHLIWRASRRRLDFEQMRDSMLAASAELDLTVGGPAVELSNEPFPLRRTVYGRVDRQNLPGMFRTFDFANPDTHSAGRFQTAVPQQGLFLMNHPFVLDRARALIKRVDAESITEPRSRVARLYQFVLARDPAEEEISAALAFVEASAPADPAKPVEFGPWQQMAQGLLLTNEFMFLD